MFDQRIRSSIDPILNIAAIRLLSLGISPNRMSVAGFVLGIGAGLCVMMHDYGIGLVFFLLSRIADGLDGHLARLSTPTDFGGFLDIVCDFIFYAFIPFSFAVAQPEAAIAAAFLIFSFVGTGTSFLAYAILEAKHPTRKYSPQKKGFYYLGGLTEGAETIAVLGACFIFPSAFYGLAFLFGCLCLLTSGQRVYQTWIDFGKES